MLTLAASRTTRIPEALQLCPDDERLAAYLNEAQDRLLTRGRWEATVARIQLCTSEAMITWPRMVKSIDAAALCSQPITIRNKWYEFLDYGPGQLREDRGFVDTLVDRGRAFTFADVDAETGSYLKAYADLSVDAGAELLLQGIDDSDNRILTNSGDTDGEVLSLTVAGTQSTKIFKQILGVQKPRTKGPVRLYAVDPLTLVQELIAVYEPGETLPSYRRSLIPCLSTVTCCAENNPCDPDKTVIVLARLAHVPVYQETDYFVIDCEPALKDMAMSIQKRERNLIQEALAYEASALLELNRQLEHFEGGAIPVLRVINQSYGPPVMNIL